MLPSQDQIIQDVRKALEEDIGSGDITAALVDANLVTSANVFCQEDALLCGSSWFEQSFLQLDDQVSVYWDKQDGQWLTAGTRVARITGPTRSLLTGERTALNFLQLLSGTATKVFHINQQVRNHNLTLLDTRKTIPGLRQAQKYAVHVGGAQNHRHGLWDAFLIKENHIDALGGSVEATIKAAQDANTGQHIIIEIEDYLQFKQAIDCKATHIMLDNMSSEQIQKCVKHNKNRAKLEVSGNVAPEQLELLGQLGVDYVSMGSLTKDVSAIDFTMLTQRLL